MRRYTRHRRRQGPSARARPPRSGRRWRARLRPSSWARMPYRRAWPPQLACLHTAGGPTGVLVHWQVCVPHLMVLLSMLAARGAHAAPPHMTPSAVERPGCPSGQWLRQWPRRSGRGSTCRRALARHRQAAALPREALAARQQHKPEEVHHLRVQCKAAPGASASGARRPTATPSRRARSPRRRPRPTRMRGASWRRARRRRRPGPAGAAGRAACGAARAAARPTARARPPTPSWRPRCSTRSPTSCSLVRIC